MKVSVCMITFLHEAFIKEAIEGVLGQECDFDFELIIVDDASPDNTEKIVDMIVAENPKGYLIRYYKHSANLGVRENFIWALEHCSGKYIALCEGDDYWTDQKKLQKQVDFLDRNSDFVLCFTRFKTKMVEGRDCEQDGNGRYFYDPHANFVYFDLKKFLVGWHIGTQTALFRSDALNFDLIKSLRHFKDVGLYVMLLLKGRAACLNFFSAVYRLHPGGIYTGKSDLDNLRISYRTYKDIANVFHKNRFLKLKYLRFARRLRDELIRNLYLKEAIRISISIFKTDLNVKNISATVWQILRTKEKQFKRKIAQKNPSWLNYFGIHILPHPSFYTRTKSYGITRAKRKERVIVSLTSYKGRIPFVHHTIDTLLTQSLKPDEVVLWLAKEEFPDRERQLPKALMKLTEFGLTIAWHEDVKSYLKLIPAYRKFYNDVIVTADDDVYYEENWLELLYSSYLNDKMAIHCHRAHRIVFDCNGKILPYSNWFHCIESCEGNYANFFTGVGGVLYPPKSLHSDIIKKELFVKLAPKADDIWFWAMAVLNGTKIIVIPDNISEVVTVERTQDVCLFSSNVHEGGNDVQLENVVRHYPNLKLFLQKMNGSNQFRQNLIKYGHRN
jgi:glycosyltransferase involved in cell wall biosynthesis